jgi:hypothetical protein
MTDERPLVVGQVIGLPVHTPWAAPPITTAATQSEPQFVDVGDGAGSRTTLSVIAAVLLFVLVPPEDDEVNVSPGAPVSQSNPEPKEFGVTVDVVALAERLIQPGAEPLSVAVVDGSAKAVPLARNQVAIRATDITASRKANRSFALSEGPTTCSLVLINPHLLVR